MTWKFGKWLVISLVVLYTCIGAGMIFKKLQWQAWYRNRFKPHKRGKATGKLITIAIPRSLHTLIKLYADEHESNMQEAIREILTKGLIEVQLLEVDTL